MIPLQASTNLMRAAMQMTAVTIEAQAVILMRIWGMAGLWNVTPQENRRMVTEKVTAALKSQQAAATALLAGRSPAQTVTAALAPIRKKTSSNLVRLTKRGPKLT